MRLHNWTFKAITEFDSNIKSVTYFKDYYQVKQYKISILEHYHVKIKVFPYGGVVE